MFLKKINSRLKDRIDEHDADIEKMCNHHYQGFIYSVKELLHVKSDATQLKSDVVKIDTDLRGKLISREKKNKLYIYFFFRFAKFFYYYYFFREIEFFF